MEKLMRGILLLSTIMGLGACSSGEQLKAGKTVEKPATEKMVYFEAHHDGRINVFDDTKTYLLFLKLGETTYRLTRIGAGPKGESVVFGLTKKDKKKRSGIMSVEMFDGKMKPFDDFYGELLLHDRYFVFNSWKDLTSVKQTGEAVYRYTQIGAGPAGKTVVFVLHKSNKKKKPVDLIAQFRRLHNI